MPVAMTAPPWHDASTTPPSGASPSACSQYESTGQSDVSIHDGPGATHFWNEHAAKLLQHNPPQYFSLAQHVPLGVQSSSFSQGLSGAQAAPPSVNKSPPSPPAPLPPDPPVAPDAEFVDDEPPSPQDDTAARGTIDEIATMMMNVDFFRCMACIIDDVPGTCKVNTECLSGYCVDGSPQRCPSKHEAFTRR